MIKKLCGIPVLILFAHCLTMYGQEYRLPSYDNWIEPHQVSLMDAQRAMRLVRYNAKKWNIDPEKIGIMGFSAGGHLAATLGTHFDYGHATSSDSVERIGCRPDFMILMYPVISFDDLWTQSLKLWLNALNTKK